MTTRKLIVGGGENGTYLQDFLAIRLDLSRNKAKQIIDSRNVFVNRRRVWMARHSLRSGDRVEFPDQQDGISSSANTAKIVYEDHDYIVVNKTPGILSNGENSLEERLKKQVNLPQLKAVHRLDKDTSGCLLFAKHQQAFDAMVSVFEERSVIKIYEAIAAGQVEPRNLTIKTPIDHRPAVSHVRTFTSNRFASHLQITIETGRMHQIRKHLLSVKHPVLGDKNYGTRLQATDKTISINRQMLHASSIQFNQPLTNRRVNVCIPPPADFTACLNTFHLLR